MRRGSIFLLSLALLAGEFLSGERAIDYRARVWSDTRPAINLTHIFAGEINRRGRPVGFHSRPGGIDPAGSGVVRLIDRPNRLGVYTALVWVGRRGMTKMSTFYPDRLTRPMVIQAILFAHRRSHRRGERFSGPSGFGFTIEGYVQNGRISTAYPLYSR
jgi:hypothetical protein